MKLLVRSVSYLHEVISKIRKYDDFIYSAVTVLTKIELDH